MTRSIFHLRLKDFELQVERLMDASLRTRPAVILSSPSPDGTVVALSEEAREEGIYPGMKVSLLRKKGHGVLFLPYNRTLYDRFHIYLSRGLRKFSPCVEPSSYGEFFLDMTGVSHLFRGTHQAAFSMVRDVSEKAGMVGGVGISANKLVSRIATAVVPEPVWEVERGEEGNFLAPLSSSYLPTAQEKTVSRVVRFLFLERVVHIQRATAAPNEAEAIFGMFASRLTRECHGEDTAAVKPPLLRDHIIDHFVLSEATNEVDRLRGGIQMVSERVGHQLRRRGEIARRVQLEVHYTDGYRLSHSGSLSSNDDISIFHSLWGMFEKANSRRNRVRAIVVDATDCAAVPPQLNLFSSPEAVNHSLSMTIDLLREKYGVKAVQTGNVLGIA